MQNILISTIRIGAVAVLALSLFVNEAFAAPVLTHTAEKEILETSATLVSRVVNPVRHNTTVWFELGETPTPTNIVGMRDVYWEAFFEGHISGLKPGTTYYFRAVAVEGGSTVYSPVSSLVTRGGAVSNSVNNSVQMNSVSAGVSTGVANTTSATVASEVKTSAPAPVSKIVSTQNTQKVAVAKNSNTRENTTATAAVSNTSGVLPGTLIGWVALLIGLLIVFLIAAMIIDGVEERRKAREEAKKKKLERENETE